MLNSIQAQSNQIIDNSNEMQKMAKRMQHLSNKSQISINITQKSNVVTKENHEAAKNVLFSIQNIRQHIQGTYKHIKRLGERSLEISEVNDFTANLTQQIHILALNAAVVASRAGESGKGLNVIAQEVQKLAEKSSQSMNQVEDLIYAIQHEVKEASNSIEQSTQAVVEITQLSDRMDKVLQQMDDTHQNLIEHVQSIIKDILQEADVAHELAQRVKNLSDINQQTLDKTHQNEKAGSNLIHVIQNLQQSVERFTIDH